jgi:EmrB/QacA subfamily drug resistance transporter
MAQTLDARTTVRDGGLEREILTLAAVVVLGTIMTVLDLTIVNVAIPTLGRELATSIAAIQWVMTGYMLAFASVIPLAGWASERFGAKRVWIAALLVFVAGSALCGLAWSIGSLIAFRVLQGLGAGMILPVGQTMLAQAAGPQRMGRVMSLIGVPMLLAPVLGPVLGGVIVEEESWRWIFFLNLPVGVAAIVAARRLLPEARPQLGQRLDLRGLALLTPGIALFLYGVSEAGSAGGFANAGTLAAAALGLALVAAFVRHARVRGRAALIDVSLFARRRFATAATVNALLPAALFGTLLLIPLYYQLVRHESPLRIGLLLVPQGIGAALAMPLAGYLTDRIGAGLVVTVGAVVAVVGTLAYTQVGVETTYAYLAAALFVLGIGAGSTIMPSMAAAFQALAREETPRATSALNVIQRTAGAIGTALLAIVLQRAIAADFPGGQEGIQALAARSSGETAGAAGAITDAFATTFWVAAALIALALVPAMLLPRTRAHARPENASPARGVSA